MLVLHQEKINGDLKPAIEGLNKAAAAIRDGLSNPTLKIVYICFVYDAANVDAAKSTTLTTLRMADCPVVFVNKELVDVYITPTFAPAVASCVLRHNM